MATINPQTIWPLFKLKHQGREAQVFWEMPLSNNWFKFRLYLILEQGQESQDKNFQIDLIPPEIERSPRRYFLGKRFSLIEEDMKRRKNVTSDHNQNRD
jgi:hypothetical protein